MKNRVPGIVNKKGCALSSKTDEILFAHNELTEKCLILLHLDFMVISKFVKEGWVLSNKNMTGKRKYGNI